MTIERQAAEVRLVKKFEAGVIRDPITVAPQTPIREVHADHARAQYLGVCRSSTVNSWSAS